jgi:glutaredoxin 3
MNIVIYTKSNCPNCTTAKRLLDDKGIGYESYDIEKCPEVLKQLASIGVRQMPQIFIEGQRVGGIAGLQAALKQLGL